MRSKTHLAVGITAALALCRAQTPRDIVCAVIGGTAGAILCDIECRSTPKLKDALYGRINALSVVVIALAADIAFGFGLGEAVAAREKGFLAAGAMVLALTCLFGRVSRHRTFTHSLTYVALLTFSGYCLTPSLALPVAIGALSHLAIDTLNRKRVCWLYPFVKRGCCIGLCYADGLVDRLLFWGGTAAALVLLAIKTNGFI